ncbi:MAG: DUF1800 domain-containing protein [Chitinophagaceae bacterium]
MIEKNHHKTFYSGLKTYSGAWDYPTVRHLLKRTLFGATKKDIQYFQSIGFDNTINELLSNQYAEPSPPLKDYNPSASVAPDNTIGIGQTWINDMSIDGTLSSLRRSSFKKWWIGQMINQSRSIREKMVLFWHNHFATESIEVSIAQYIYKHHKLLRSSALGNFKDLTKKITLDPAMLIYLNGQNNNKTAPDENYARELQELFVIGKGTNALFTEDDVKAAAKILTGWRNNNTKLEPYFDLTRHDISNKTFSTFYGGKTIQGMNSSNGGETELDQLIDLLLSQKEAALFICRRLYTWFVYYDITPEVERDIIEPLADIFRKNNYEILPVLRALLSSEHFFDNVNRGCQIKSPADLIVGLTRELEIKFPPSDQVSTTYTLWNQLVAYLSASQQDIGDPPDVSGWKAYYQAPLFYGNWINTDTMPKRLQYSQNLISPGYTAGGFKMIVPAIDYVKGFQNPSDPNKLLDDICGHLLGVDISINHKNQIKKDILLSGQIDDHYWTNAWDTYINSPNLTSNTNYVNNSLVNLLKYIINLPEYQLG